MGGQPKQPTSLNERQYDWAQCDLCNGRKMGDVNFPGKWSYPKMQKFWASRLWEHMYFI